MTQHVTPLTDQLVSGWFDGRECRERNLFEVAFRRHDSPNRGGAGRQLAVVKQVHYVVEIARPRALAERPDLLAEYFLIGIAECLEPLRECIRIRMRHRARHGQRD